ncbi:tripartite motif-containing protein 45-like [Gigantopelta aegis]|uniref:tripartite motif-containing protein 45-like n=1 Tax=Gigantopelta aegis TaxID=1735272 RepID=UPI001B889024|nr:tripartite motif-containing protein 45-like [Gigantopelta aegis]
MDSEKIERLRERLLVCPICMDEYKDPRLLPCHHTVCLECIRNYLQASSVTGRMFRCPQCRYDVCVPREGIKEFPLNFYIISLQDELGTKSYHDCCDICKRDWMVSQFRCVDCDLVICKFCIHEHKLFEHDVSKNYNIMRIEISPADFHMSSTRSCPRHMEELLQLYCNTCDKPVCIVCMCEDHKRHDTISMSNKLTQARTYLQNELDRLTTEKRAALKALEDVQTTSDSLGKWTRQTTDDIMERAKRLHEKIDTLAQIQIGQVTEGEKENIHELNMYSKDLKTYSEDVDKGLRFLEDLQEGDMCLELLDCYGRYNNDLNNAKSKSANKKMSMKKVNFQPGWDIQFQKHFFGNFGELDLETSEQTFLCNKTEKEYSSAWRRLLTAVTPRNVAITLVVWSMLVTFYALGFAYVADRTDAWEVFACLLVCAYLYGASYFAYRKS